MFNLKNWLLAAVILLVALPLEARERWQYEGFYSKGKKHTIEQYEGKDVLLMFYATWCGYCKEELPNLANLRRLTNKNLVILPVSVDFEPDSDIKNFLSRHGASNLDVFVDMSGRFSESFAVRSVPSFFVISKQGFLSDRYSSLDDLDYGFFDQYLKNE